ncbi:MAG: GTP 3',8-cyclase MoaA, partial [Thermoplasmata archaeon]
MIDSYGRPVNSIRVSVTKECNLNCFYCHREGIKGEKDILIPEDFETLFKVVSSLGIKKIKFTG